MNVWNAVKEHGMWAHIDFSIKVDPDAMMLPERLRDHLRPYVTYGPTYIKNCNKMPGDPDFPMIFGALEVLSREAFRIYLHGQEECKRKLQWKTWGEDFFLTKCLDMLGVNGLGDF